MIREAIYYGLWAAACLMLTALAFFGLLAFAVDRVALAGLGTFALMALPTGAVAGLGWSLMHRAGRPNWLGYVVLAVGTVVVSHLVIAAVLLFPTSGQKTDLITYLIDVVLTILYHGWLTVPVALLGTALFVWLRQRMARKA